MSALALAALLLATPADELVVGTLAEPAVLEPHRTTDAVAAEIVSNVCETLVRLRPGSGRPEGVLATSWATADQRVWSFTLRSGVRFQDGAPFDADAVVANFEHLRHERAFPGRAERLGPHLVELRLERANAALLQTLSQPFFSFQSPRLLGAGELPVGTGPFRLVAARPGTVELVAFDGHWAGAPRLRRLVFRRFADAAALALALESGAADVSSALGPDEATALRGHHGLLLDSQGGLNLVYLALNNTRAPFSDVRVRQAISRSIDRAALVRSLGGHAEAANGPLPPSVFGHDARARDLVLDPEQARRLLEAAHVPRGTRLTLSVSAAPRPYLTQPLRVAERLHEQLERLGFDVRQREVPTWAGHIELTTRGDYELALLGWQADTLDPNDFLTALLDSGSIGTTNRVRYASEPMDRLLRRARMESAGQARLALYTEAQALFQTDMPFVPLFHAPAFTAHRGVVRGLVIGPTGVLRYDKAWKQQ